MRAASSPSTVWSISGVCMAGSIAGWAHTNSNLSRSSGNSVDAFISVDSFVSERSVGSLSETTCRWRMRSMNEFRAAVSSQASGFSEGHPPATPSAP